jgi:FkbM family methyltransferase
MSHVKEYIRGSLARCGWFVRRTAGLPAGVNFEHDFLTTARLRSPEVMLDVGAHRGETAERFTLSFPLARVISFEPVAANFAVLKSRAKAWPRVECHQLALGARAETVEIVLQPDSQTNTLRERANPKLSKAGCETITVTTLDEISSKLGVDQIDLLKIDTEGYELAVLAGGANLFRDRRIKCILLEATLDPADTTHTALSAVCDFLRPHEYNLAALYDQVIWREPVRLAYFNALFVPAATR